MTGPTPPPGRAVSSLGARLRTLREAAGLSGVELAERLGASWRQSKVSKLETGRQLPTESELTAWAEATGADAAPLYALRSKASATYGPWKERIAGAGGPLALQEEITALSRSCTFLAEFQAALVPGNLQTPTYVREMTAGDEAAEDDGLAADLVDHVIAAKIRRQALLYEPGREIVHVVGEAALRTRYGRMSVATLRAQVLALAELSTLPRHTFGVVPFSTPLPVPVAGFALYDRDLVVVETVAGALQLTDPDSVARHVHWLDRLQAAALTGPAAAAFCRTVAAEAGADEG